MGAPGVTPRTDAPARESANGTRRRIARALVELVGADGYRETTLDQLFERSGVDQEEFERHFSGLEDCFRQVWGELADAFLKSSVQAYRSEKPWRERIRAMVAFTVHCANEDPVRARFLLVESLTAGDAVQAQRDATMGRLIELVDAGRGELDDPTGVSRATAEAVVGGAYRTLTRRLRERDFEALASLTPELMCQAVMPYLGVDAALRELELRPD